MTTFSDAELREVGHTIALGGAVYLSESKVYLCLLPGDAAAFAHVPPAQHAVLAMTTPEWEAFFRATDLLETPVWSKTADGSLAKIIARKSQRQIDQDVAWRVFRRDQYQCRYCGRNDVALTVDHLVCWEDGGPTSVDNLVAACRRCNHTRGRLAYGEWLRSKAYRRTSAALTAEIRQANADLALTLDAIPRTFHVRSR